MSTPDQLVEVARSQRGVHESPRGSNRTPYGQWFGFQGVAWCSIFVAWCLAQIGLDPRHAIDGYASCAMALSGWRRMRRTVAKTAIAPGDILFFKLGRRGGFTNHTGIATSVPYKRRGRWVVDSVDGNTNASGSRTGGEVQEKTRPLSQVVGVARPQYAPNVVRDPIFVGDEPARLAFWFAGIYDQHPDLLPTLDEGAIGDWVRAWQGTFRWCQGGSDPVDGTFGPDTAATVRWVQGKAGQPQTGRIDRKAWDGLRYLVHAKASS